MLLNTAYKLGRLSYLEGFSYSSYPYESDAETGHIGQFELEWRLGWMEASLEFPNIHDK